jgi:hypothetical protein
MGKIIKKIVRVLLTVVAVLIIVPAVIMLLLQAPRVQTFTVRQITGILSGKTGAEISIGKVSYSYFRKVLLEDLLFEDHNGDTLLAVRKANLRIRSIRPSEGRFSFGRTDLHDADFRMVTDTSGVMNLTRYIDAISGDREPDTASRVDIRFSDIYLHNGAYLLSNRSDSSGTIPGKVNFNHLRLSEINARVRDLSIIRDSVSMVIRDFAFAEAGGFKTESLDMNIAIASNKLSFRDINLNTAASSILADRIILTARDSASWKDFINEVRFDMLFQSSDVATQDLAWFIEPLRGISESVTFSGRLSGTVAELNGRDIAIKYSASTSLNFDFDISGLPSINDSYLFVDFTEMSTIAADVEKVILPGRAPIRLPEPVHGLGLISYSGSFTGFTTDFVSFGKLTTERGSVSTDLSLKPDGRNRFSFKGFLSTSDFDLGYVTGNTGLFGGLWMHADLDGSMESFRHLSANISGVIDSVEINSYNYRNIAVEGSYGDSIWDGSVSVRDPAMVMDLMGRFDLEKSMPEFDFTLNLSRADLHRMNLINSDTIFNASALLTASFRGNRTNNIEGEIRLINSTLNNSNGELSIYDFLISALQDNGENVLKLRSDFGDAEVRGRYTFEAIPVTVKRVLADLYPSRFPLAVNKEEEEVPEADFTLSATIRKIDKLNDFMGTGLSIAEGSRIIGSLNSDRSEISIALRSGAITYAGNTLRSMNLSGSAGGGLMSVTLEADTLLLPDRSVLGNFVAEAGSHTDTLDLDMRWDNRDGGRTFGEISARGFFSHNHMNRPSLTVSLLPTALTVDRVPWSVSPARIVIDSTTAWFDNILVNSSNKYIRLDGKISPEPEERLTLTFEGLNLSYVNNLGSRDRRGHKEKSPASPQMKIGGVMGGYITLSDIYEDFLFESNFSVSDFMLNENRYGLLSVMSEWNPQARVAEIHVFNDYEGARYFDISGSYSPSLKGADLTVETNSMPLDVINPLVGTFASDVRGSATGVIRLQGGLKDLMLSGAVMARDASMKIDFLQTRYNFSDSIRFSHEGILFSNIRIFDELKNQGTINGMLSHRSFNDIGISLDINMERMMVLNTRSKDSESFYGTAFASGYAGIRGNEERLSFNISARTASGTEFFIPLNSSSSVSDYPYIVFSDPSGNEVAAEEERTIFTRQAEGSNLDLNFDLAVTPEARVQLIMDATSGGVIRGTGSGNLNINLNSKGDLRMAGDYVISDGDYLFTLGNILNKRFVVEEGGTISWNGEIDDAVLDLKAIYRTKASLAPLSFAYTDIDKLKERLPVECHLLLSDKLLNPAINFDIYLPTADEETRDYLRMAIDTEEELSRQFLYLLVMNSFYTDPALYSATGGSAQIPYSPTETQDATILGMTTTTEMLSNQLSNWLSQISNDFDIGFNYRPGDQLTDDEIEVALSTQLLNDRITLNGNLDVGGAQTTESTSKFSGEFTIEFRLTEMLRLKVFNRSNNILFYPVHPYTQGAGVFYRRDFDRLDDLFINPGERRKKNIVQEEETGGK